MANFGHFFALLKQLPGARKDEIIYVYSDGKTQSLTELYELYPEKYRHMITELEKRCFATTSTTIRKLRSGILTRLQKYGLNTTDWNEVNRFLEQPKIAGKKLYDLTIPEMQTLITKLEAINTKQHG